MTYTDKRLHAAATLAGPFIDRGLGARHGDRFLGTTLLPPGKVQGVMNRLDIDTSRPLIDILVDIVTSSDEVIERQSINASIARRFNDYEQDRLSWEARASSASDWRSRMATVGQRYLIQSICQIRTLEMPIIRDRGTAADWIDAQGGPVLLELVAFTKVGA